MRSAADVTAIKPLNRSAGLVLGVAFAGIPIAEMDSTASPISEVIAMKTVESAKGLANARNAERPARLLRNVFDAPGKGLFSVEMRRQRPIEVT